MADYVFRLSLVLVLLPLNLQRFALGKSPAYSTFTPVTKTQPFSYAALILELMRWYSNIVGGFHETKARSIGRGAGAQTFKDETMTNLRTVLPEI